MLSICKDGDLDFVDFSHHGAMVGFVVLCYFLHCLHDWLLLHYHKSIVVIIISSSALAVDDRCCNRLARAGRCTSDWSKK